MMVEDLIIKRYCRDCKKYGWRHVQPTRIHEDEEGNIMLWDATGTLENVQGVNGPDHARKVLATYTRRGSRVYLGLLNPSLFMPITE